MGSPWGNEWKERHVYGRRGVRWCPHSPRRFTSLLVLDFSVFGVDDIAVAFLGVSARGSASAGSALWALRSRFGLLFGVHLLAEFLRRGSERFTLGLNGVKVVAAVGFLGFLDGRLDLGFLLVGKFLAILGQ